MSQISLAGFFNFLLIIESRDFKLCQKLDENFFSPILMKLGVMLEVDETFTTIWLSWSSEVRVKVRRWPHSLSGLFFSILVQAILLLRLLLLCQVQFLK